MVEIINSTKVTPRVETSRRAFFRGPGMGHNGFTSWRKLPRDEETRSLLLQQNNS
jgi:hypothetical protein